MYAGVQDQLLKDEIFRMRRDFDETKRELAEQFRNMRLDAIKQMTSNSDSAR